MSSSIAYKAVSVRPEGLFSWGTEYKPVQYIPGEIVYPEYGKLFVFSDLDRAIKWAGNVSESEVWECEVTNPQENGVMCCPILEEYFEKFWKERGLIAEIWDCPRGTLLVDSVKLTRRIL